MDRFVQFFLSNQWSSISSGGSKSITPKRHFNPHSLLHLKCRDDEKMKLYVVFDRGATGLLDIYRQGAPKIRKLTLVVWTILRKNFLGHRLTWRTKPVFFRNVGQSYARKMETPFAQIANDRVVALQPFHTSTPRTTDVTQIGRQWSVFARHPSSEKTFKYSWANDSILEPTKSCVTNRKQTTCKSSPNAGVAAENASHISSKCLDRHTHVSNNGASPFVFKSHTCASDP